MTREYICLLSSVDVKRRFLFSRFDFMSSCCFSVKWNYTSFRVCGNSIAINWLVSKHHLIFQSLIICVFRLQCNNIVSTYVSEGLNHEQIKYRESAGLAAVFKSRLRRYRVRDGLLL